ncbi:phosphatidylinositol-glycan biosynthesis class F protein-like [Ptychodera flava]|uniref:phosphatidylinositol-glycan biosynthesis class F protein-like n=1 Tax=Ptychodera flava TaxID=63121 RepID=UPI00396A09B9
MAASVGILAHDVQRDDIPPKLLILNNIGQCLFILLFHFLPYFVTDTFIVISSPIRTVKLFCLSFGIIGGLTRWFANGRLQRTKVFKTTSKRSKWHHLCSRFTHIFKCGCAFGLSVLLYHLIAVLYGAAFVELVEETFMFSVLLATLSTLPCLLVLGLNGDAWSRLFTNNKPILGLESCLQQTTVITLIGAWLGAFVVPLDWDRPWQEWPISCLIGASAGHCFGLVISSLYLFYKTKDKRKGNKSKKV